MNYSFKRNLYVIFVVYLAKMLPEWDVYITVTDLTTVILQLTMIILYTDILKTINIDACKSRCLT